ncbi:porin family protein [Moraxella catarrhalis]|uniref:porin family protein n=1 Tax=Moraxella catarrhalis TaxID=480 RepID=UPI00128B0393|nr:porin family protein [Moraxella catarrhalis]MPW58860.1 porin family protein [Moraxella catarrhalis]
MKTLKTLLAVSASSLLAMSANAAISYGNSADAQPYVGAKIVQVDAKQINGKNTAYGIYAGYNFDQNFGVEAEFVGSDAKEFNAGMSPVKGDVKSFGAYGTYRYNFINTPFYAKGKLGIAKTKVDVTSRNATTYSNKSDKTSLAGGVGVGFKPLANVGVEASYNYLSEDANAISLGAHLAF